MDIDTDAVVRLLVALALGAAIGSERETSDQPAGLRTHIAVALGACLFGVISTLGFLEFRDVRANTNVQIDVTRVASQVVVGIGFLGAGMIFRQGTVVRNLTTAASLWATAAIGLAAGVGDLATATVATLVLLGALALLRPLRSWIRRYFAHHERRVRIGLVDGAEPDPVIDALNAIEHVDVREIVLEKQSGAYVVVAELRSAPHAPLEKPLADIARREDVDSLGDAT